MRKLVLLISVFVLVVASCDVKLLRYLGSSSAEGITVKRYDRVLGRYLTTGDFSALQEMNTTYPRETRVLIEDMLKLGSVADSGINRRLLEFYRDTTLQNVIFAAESEFADLSDIDRELNEAFKVLQKQIPNLRIPNFYAQIGAFDQSIVVSDNDVGISLDKYLGANYPAYSRFYDKQMRSSMKREFIVPDCLVFYLWSLYAPRNMHALTQNERDMVIAKFMWVADYATKKHVFDSPFTAKVSAYMRQHPQTTLLDLIEGNVGL
ncbi:MAG: gliding motility protein GldB [Bacteroidales bacterium]|nr:gliding motility protein GldB [Bacteroidales bacterium]